MNIFGIVEKVVERTVNTKRGPTPVFDIYVDGTKYSWGFQRPTKFGITDGAEIKFQATPDTYGPKVQVESVEVVTNGSGAAPVKVAHKTAGATGGSGGGGWRDAGFPVPVTSEKISILRQNALTNAVNAVNNNAKLFEIKTQADLVKTILDVAREFSDYTSGRDVEEKVAKLTSKMED